MLIKVELYDGFCVRVCQDGLDRLLEYDRVKGFERGSGWVAVGVHPIRRAPGLNGYNCIERRRRVAGKFS